MNKQETSNKPESFNNFNAEIEIASPGRINLIGEHTDYNGGFVMPTAIDRKIFFKIRKNNTENSARIYSQTFDSFFEFDMENITKSDSTWENYILGVVNEIQKKGGKPRGFDCIIRSELPIGAGISSSAALECGLASALNALFKLNLSEIEIVELSQKAENNFVGSNCGIMDQYASVMSRKDHLILLDCKTLQAEYIPADFKNCKILLLNTNVAHSLADTEYNTRRRECEDSVAIIQKKYPEVESLRDIDFKILEEMRGQLSETQYRRSFYVLKENERVIKAANAIKTGNLKEFGELMYQSHEGLQHNYQVSCPELDFLVDFSRDKDYIFGSRMMGGGFGGCTINIIESDKIEIYVVEAAEAYYKKFGIKLDAITVSPSEGTQIKRN